MPAKTGKQYRLMQAIANDKSFRKKEERKGVGPSKKVAEDMIEHTPEKKRSLFMKKEKTNPKKFLASR